jgi:signal transduction histidine kinase
MQKKSFGNLLIIRYVIYFAIVLSIIVFNKSIKVYNVSKFLLLLSLLLLYIINSQVRIYFLAKKHVWIIISLLCEIIIITFLYYKFGGFTFIYYFISILDASLMLPKIQAAFLIFAFYIAVAFESLKPNYYIFQHQPMVNVLFNTFVVIGIAQLGSYIEEQKNKKDEAQKLYDKIRSSEEKLKEAYDKLEKYSDTVEEITILRERNRISREIHDTVGHTLSTLIIQLQAVPFVMKSDPAKANEMINDMVVHTKTGLEDVRRAVRELKPSDFDENNGLFVLTELISSFQKNTSIKVEFVVSKNQYSLTSDQSFTLYRIFQETFNNAIRHGGATCIKINMDFSENEIYVYIKDNGKGCSEIKRGCGLDNINDRIKSIGGNAAYHSEDGKGFEINLLLPRVQNIVKLQ